MQLFSHHISNCIDIDLGIDDSLAFIDVSNLSSDIINGNVLEFISATLVVEQLEHERDESSDKNLHLR